MEKEDKENLTKKEQSNALNVDSSLRLDWCSFKAAKYAVENWHYSKRMPSGKLTRIGVWEDGEYKGCVLFGRGGNRHLGEPYGCKQTESCELVRIALREHKAPVTQIVKISLKMLKKLAPGIRLIISYADENKGHFGGIYKGGNWVYAGKFASEIGIKVLGRIRHRRSINSLYNTSSIEWLKKNIDPNTYVIKGKSKHKYLYPLDNEIRTKIKGFAKPYPKNASIV